MENRRSRTASAPRLISLRLPFLFVLAAGLVPAQIVPRVGVIDVYGLRKVPDWSQGLDPVYGEPKGKPCPECLEWPR